MFPTIQIIAIGFSLITISIGILAMLPKGDEEEDDPE